MLVHQRVWAIDFGNHKMFRFGPHLAKGRFGGARFTADPAFGVALGGGGGALPLPLPRVEIGEELQQEV